MILAFYALFYKLISKIEHVLFYNKWNKLKTKAENANIAEFMT